MRATMFLAGLLIGSAALSAAAQQGPGDGQGGMQPGMMDGPGPMMEEGMIGGDQRGAMAMQLFERLDADGDGRLTREEVRAARAARVDGLDADGDGFLTAEELVAHQTRQAQSRIAERVDEMMARNDLDGDGRLGVTEMAGAGGIDHGPERMFDRLDTDGDGAVTRAEVEAAQDRMAGMRGRMGGGGHGMMGDGQGRGGFGGWFHRGEN